MYESQVQPAGEPPPRFVRAGADRFGEHHGLGISVVDFKICSTESTELFLLENTFHAKGGPARHLHHNQDEWFCAVEGEFLMEIGTAQFHLLPGDSLFAPRRVPHVWAHVGAGRGRILVAFTPAGKMEAFFRATMTANAMPALDPNLWQAYEMELLGPPLAV